MYQGHTAVYRGQKVVDTLVLGSQAVLYCREHAGNGTQSSARTAIALKN